MQQTFHKMQIYFDSTLGQLVYGDKKLSPTDATIRWIDDDRFVIYHTSNENNIVPELKLSETTDEGDNPYADQSTFETAINPFFTKNPISESSTIDVIIKEVDDVERNYGMNRIVRQVISLVDHNLN